MGWVSFGGPAGQIAILHAELVQRRRWISEGRFLHALNYCMLLPGPEAQQLATYLGWLLHRTRGAVAAGVLFVLPSLGILVLLSWLYVSHGEQPLVAAVLWAIKPAVVAIVLHAAWRIGTRVLRTPVLWALAALAFVALAGLSLPFPLVVLGAALCGWVLGRVWPDALGAQAAPPAEKREGAASAANSRPAALIDDHTPPPAHARFSRLGLAKVLAAGAALWALPMGMLVAWAGPSGTLAQMGLFFTQAALLTFGGAYAVLPFVVQGAVQHHGWITATQMIDGLALGETTPGPLIMVVAFVGFVGAWQSPDLLALFGPDGRLAAAVFAALLVTWFTFLPSFVFILAGGPLVEGTRGSLAFTAPLTAITAAVVGVIASLALFFALHVLWPSGWRGPVDAVAAVLTLAAAALLFSARAGVMTVIALAAAAGLAGGLAGWLPRVPVGGVPGLG